MSDALTAQLHGFVMDHMGRVRMIFLAASYVFLMQLSSATVFKEQLACFSTPKALPC